MPTDIDIPSSFSGNVDLCGNNNLVPTLNDNSSNSTIFQWNLSTKNTDLNVFDSTFDNFGNCINNYVDSIVKQTDG